MIMIVELILMIVLKTIKQNVKRQEVKYNKDVTTKHRRKEQGLVRLIF